MAACRGIERLAFVPHQLSGRERPRFLSWRAGDGRARLSGFRAGLPPLPLGRDRLQRLRDEGFVVHVVTKGPRQRCAA